MPSAPASTEPRSRAGSLGPLAALAAAFAVMVSAGWGRWPDLLSDFGHEAYVPWRVSTGVPLTAFPPGATGPLSPAWNALLFRIFGPGLEVLVVANLAVLAGVTALLYGLARELFGRLAATAGALVFLLALAFGFYLTTGAYQFAAPYAHGLTHGLLFALLALAALARADRDHRDRDDRDDRDGAAIEPAAGLTRLERPRWARRGAWPFAAGLCLGLVFLTKPEVFVAAAGAAALHLAARARSAGAAAGRSGFGAFGRLGLPVVVGAVVPPAVAVAALAARAPLAVAWRTAAAPWVLAATPLPRTGFYARLSGLDAPGAHLVTLLVAAAGWLAFLGAVTALDRFAARVEALSGPRGRVATAVAAGLLAAGAASLLGRDAWLAAVRPLPAVALAGAMAWGLAAWRAPAGDDGRRGPAGDEGRRARRGLAGFAFALALLAKILLAARVAHYGFALAAPAVVLGAAWLVGRARGGGGPVRRGAALGVLAAFAAFHATWSVTNYRALDVPVGAGRDRVLGDARSVDAANALARLEALAAPGDTLTVVPEGAMLNYLARRPSPAPYLTWLPDALLAYGEPAMLRALEAAPPDWIVLVSRDAGEMGARTFGVDYARDTLRWIEARYVPVARSGGHPLAPEEGFGTMLLRRGDGSRSGPP